MEVAIRRRPRLRVVLDLRLRARLARFDDRALCSNLVGGRKPGELGIGRTANPKILV